MQIGFRPMQGGNCFEEALEEVKLAEHVGFDSIWLTEHHGWDVSWPSPQLPLAAFAAQTETIKLGPSVILLPMANPVRLAGELAMLDEISNGRLVCGVGLGYQEREFDALNFPIEGRVTRFIENLKLLRRLFRSKEVSFQGKTYELSEFTLSPRPVQDGGPPIWCGGSADRALRRAAYLGDEWLATWTRPLSMLLDAKETYIEYLEEAGKDPNDYTYPVIRAVVVAEERDIAVERARQSIQPVIEGYLEEGYNTGFDPESFDDIMEVADNQFIIGTPEEVRSQLREFIKSYGTEHLIMKVQGPGMKHEDVLETAELLGEEVLPYIR